LVIDTPVKIEIVDAPNRPLTSLIDSTKFDMLVAPVSPGILGVPDIVAITGFGEKPPPLRPELRTARSEGYEINISVAYGFASPKGLSREMFSRLEEALKKISTRPDFISRLRSATGLDPVFQSGQELGRRTSMAHNDYCENCKKGNYCPIHEDCKKECPDCK